MRLTTGTLLIGIFAILFALIGAYALRAALVKDVLPPQARPRTISVPVASNHLPPGRKLVISDMSPIPMTEKEIAERNLPLDILMISADQIVGRVLRDGVKQGDAFVTTNLYPEGERPNLADKLAPGYVAFTIPIDDFNGVGGAVAVGSLVDVLFRTRPRPGDVANRIAEIPEATVTLIESVEVIAVSRENIAPRGNANDQLDSRQVNRNPASNSLTDLGGLKAVTLSITPDQANILKAASGRGEMSLDLRSAVGGQQSSLGPVTLEKILGLKTPAAPQSIEFWHGGSRTVLTYDENGMPVGGAGTGGFGGTSNVWGSQANGGGLHYYGSGNGPSNGGNSGYGGGYGNRTTDLPNAILPYPASGVGAPAMPQNNPGPRTNSPAPNSSTQSFLPPAYQMQANWRLPNGDAFAWGSPAYGYPYAPPGMIAPMPPTGR